MRLITLQNFNVSNRFFAAKFHHRHFQTIMRIAPDLGFNLAIKRHNAIGDGAVNAFHAAALQLLHQMVLRGQRFGNHHQAAGVFIQAVHDACARHLRQLGRMGEQAVEQRARPVACGGVHHQACRFVEHQHAVVFVHNIQRHGFGRVGLRFLAGLNIHRQLLAADELGFGRGGLPVAQHFAVFYPTGDAAARIIGQHFGERGIKAQPRQIDGNA